MNIQKADLWTFYYCVKSHQMGVFRTRGVGILLQLGRMMQTGEAKWLPPPAKLYKSIGFIRVPFMVKVDGLELQDECDAIFILFYQNILNSYIRLFYVL